VTAALPALTTSLSRADLQALEAAVAALERTSFARRMAQLAGKQIGFAGRAMPAQWRQASAIAARRALEAALRIAIGSLQNGGPRLPHRKLVGICGALGGAAGVAALPLELPVSTTLMLRAIAEIARAEGEDLSHPSASFACLEVFALGGHGEGEGVFEGGYLALRGVFAKSVSDAAGFVAAGGAATESAPVIARLIAKLSTRFGVVVSQKSAVQAAPIRGALGGAAVNLAFMEHFETLARGHFTVRRLERAYGEYEVRSEYARIAREAGFWAKERA
jgi:hypothetical protein